MNEFDIFTIKFILTNNFELFPERAYSQLRVELTEVSIVYLNNLVIDYIDYLNNSSPKKYCLYS